MIRLLALDMDGTCLNGRSRMTEETIRTIRKAADAGIIRGVAGVMRSRS